MSGDKGEIKAVKLKEKDKAKYETLRKTSLLKIADAGKSQDNVEQESSDNWRSEKQKNKVVKKPTFTNSKLELRKANSL